ncbi:protein T24A6.7, putative [Entamoeba histolytica HM-3:IMSS]|uniref:NADAR domain-containing protein n=4 Tax=Entamoeba histolytica TaxID=5759 RepID=C4M3G4_ENTH1|nr:hypothetical protein, conserved [Entamoeba histolytica HM-1:IMSS]EAL46858.1 hypothetical protein, conserved [Entamoeba histolytica HM-1:IMSS]EMD48410.1 Hypothetical protein EHI5A_245520 [Entamoeba histolytica KU27]EMS17950.1 protein T24A6.7, putative [Entamoeba histolytica HM-3:IMSS]GAT95845.1 hypothetical protein conserved [Entamoeba histolytica]|eukprot:XP_652245.1 hypothetical protein, conserved [Entamoeba histolytica HM-1:IMSS]
MESIKERYEMVNHYSMKWLLEDIDINKQQHQYTYFWKPSIEEEVNKSCLGNWYPSEFDYDGIHYYFCEQFLMGCKAKLFGDDQIFKLILDSRNPYEMKKLGKKVKGFNQEVWDEYKAAVMFEGGLAKFTQNPQLRRFLMETGDDILVEASKFDAVWGIKMEESDERANDPHQWCGENILGFTLMSIRDYLLV